MNSLCLILCLRGFIRLLVLREDAVVSLSEIFSEHSLLCFALIIHCELLLFFFFHSHITCYQTFVSEHFL